MLQAAVKAGRDTGPESGGLSHTSTAATTPREVGAVVVGAAEVGEEDAVGFMVGAVVVGAAVGNSVGAMVVGDKVGEAV